MKKYKFEIEFPNGNVWIEYVMAENIKRAIESMMTPYEILSVVCVQS